MVESAEKSPVGIPSVSYESMVELWELIHDLLGGTATMRIAAQKWLPKESAESVSAYSARLNKSVLYNGYKDTLNKLKNRPFTHPVTITDLPKEIAYIEHDVDGNNKPLEIFIKEVLENLIKYGVAYIYVDHTIVEAVVEGESITKADEKNLGVRVYLINIAPPDLIGWQAEKTSKSKELTQIRVKDVVIEPDGDYGDKEVTYINVYTPNSWEKHQQDSENTDKYTKIGSGTHSFGEIPLVTIYANRIGYMIADPPLIDLAWLNVTHWQSYSDQRNILHFSRFGLLFGKGMPKKVVEAGSIELGPTKAILIGDDSENADLKYVEHTGKSIESGQKDITDIECKMRILGDQPLIKDIPDTATAEAIGENRTISQLQSWIRALERGLMQALKLACKWRDVTPSDTMEVSIYSDFEATILNSQDKELLLKMREAGEITGVTLLREQKRRGVFSLDMDPETEAKQAAEEDANSLKNLLPDESQEDNEFEEAPEEMEEE